jgi:hypothetical protein
MTYSLSIHAARIGASLCLMMIATGASAQVNCWMGPSVGPPPINDAHILCGEIRQRANGSYYAVGFHSRHNGINPVHQTPAGPVQIITNDHITSIPVPNMPDIYKIHNFDITQNGITQNKFESTMFPDHCSPAAVLAAIRNATGQGVLAPNSTFIGQSGGGCLANGMQFNIIAFTDANGVIDSARPNY